MQSGQRLKNYLIANGYNYDGTTTGNKIAKAMASTTGWNSSPDLGAIGNDQSLNNSSGFNAFPEGYRKSNGTFANEGTSAVFWSSTENYTNYAWFRLLTPAAVTSTGTPISSGTAFQCVLLGIKNLDSLRGCL